MIEKKAPVPKRVRKISGSFSFIEHRFLRDGFWASLTKHELLLYLFLVIVGDRQGLSYYSFDKICSLLGMSPDYYIVARNGLIDKDLIAFDGFIFQVLSLPGSPAFLAPKLLQSEDDMVAADPATVHRLIENALNKEDSVE